MTLAARLVLARGDIPKAVAELHNSVRLCRNAGLSQLLETPVSMLAEIYRRSGDLGRAEQFATEAAALAQANGDKWSLPEHLRMLANVQVAQGKYLEADRTYDKASAFIDSGLARSSSALEKTALIKASGSLYPEHFALLASRLNAPEKAYRTVEQVRGRVATDLLMAGSVNSQKAKDIERAISALQLQMMSAKTMADVQHLRDQIFTVEESRWITPGVSILKTKAQETVPVERVKQSLDSSTAVLEYVVAEPQSYCLVISRERVQIVPLAGESRLDHLVATYQKAVRGRQPAHAEARALFDALLRPILNTEHKMNLVVVRDGKLHLLPFDALETSSGKYVIESHMVVYAPSVTAYYVLNRELRHTSDSMRPLLGVGGIPYSQEARQHISRVRGQNGSPPADLRYSNQEVLDADSAVKGNNKLLLGAGATESAFKRAAGQRYQTIHMAVHGFADDPDPDKAALALLPDEAAGEDGLLHASEIAMLHLNAKLVVLSACDTAVGPIQGEEGISTLSNSFLLAGATAVVSTLWSLDDVSTLFLMQRFYSRVAEGVPAALALADAKRQMLNRFGKATVPYFWAGFIFEGAPRLSA